MLRTRGFEDRRSSEGRLVVLRVVVSVLFGLLALGFWVLQIIQNAKYEEMATSNHTRTIPLRAPRGVLFDRNGRVLVENRYSFTIAILREQAPKLDQTIRRVAEATRVDEAVIREAVRRREREPKFRPLPVIEHATFDQVAAVTARRLEMPEVVVQQVPTRAYPTDGMAAHAFGYVGEIQDAQLASAGEASTLKAGDIVGQAGLEKIYNPQLMGVDGNRYVMINSVGREIEELRKEDPVEGKRMQLSIDYDLQRALEEGFKISSFAGAAVFLDPRTGEILAMTSQPEYDPNDFAVGIDRVKWVGLNTDPKKPLQDRLVQGRYSPGSTFKILMATAALSEGLITPDYKVFCPGSATFYGHTFRCDKRDGHGSLDLRQALEQSCDVYFYKLGSMLGVDTIHKYGQLLGLVGKTGIDLPSEVDSLVPSTEWKMRTTGERWYPGETISVAIGQGQVSVTPIALATMITAIANGGTIVTPHLVKAIDEGNGWQPFATPKPRSFFPIAPDTLSAVRDGLWMAVNGAGTAGRARVAGHDVSGKTGTAQVVSLQNVRAGAAHHKDHSWFVFYAPRENPTISGVVFVENGGWGATASTPIARYVLETYFAKLDKRPLPTAKIGGDGILMTVTEPQPAAPKPPAPAGPPIADSRSPGASAPGTVGTAQR